MTVLPTPAPGRESALAWVGEHLGDLLGEARGASERFDGGQSAADTALATLDITGYARNRSVVAPPSARGASGLSPYVRHGLLPLPAVWSTVSGPPADQRKFRDELLWQEFARHLYARVGTANRRPLRYEPSPAGRWEGEPLPRSMACMDLVRTELETDGWLVNQTRVWVASQWAVRAGADWREGEDWLYRRLLDGSRAANRLGWQWTVGLGTGKPYGFSRWQVEKRAPTVCRSCPLRDACPIEDWPATGPVVAVADPDPLLRADPDPERTGGPRSAAVTGEPAVVWLHGESLGDTDPALVAHPDLPVVWVWDEALLARLRLSEARLVFLTETLAELGEMRELVVRRGDVPAELAAHGAVATTFAPVPGWRRHARVVDPVAVHPWPWLRRPGSGPVTSFSAWVRR